MASEISIDVDRERQERVIRDSARMLLVQGERYGRRRDPLRNWRSERFHRWLKRFGVAVSVIGALGSAFMAAVMFAAKGLFSWAIPFLLLVGLSLVLLICFVRAPHVLRRFHRWKNKRYWRRARAWWEDADELVPGVARYDVTTDSCRIRWYRDGEERTDLEFPASDVGYGLVGDFCIALYTDRNSVEPSVVVLRPSSESNDRMMAALSNWNLDLEQLSEELLPQHPDPIPQRSFAIVDELARNHSSTRHES